MNKVAIVGAGMSGLVVANQLKNIADVTVFEKSRGVGGRLATRRALPYVFDHGAQFFTAKTDGFQKFVETLVLAGVVKEWRAKFVEFEKSSMAHQRQWSSDYPHFVGVPGMNAVGKFLAKDINLKTSCKIAEIKPVDHDCWQLLDDDDNLYGIYDWVILTAPVEQTRLLLPNSVCFNDDLNNYKLSACFSVMLGFENNLNLDFNAALVRDADISWISVNNTKPDRPDAISLLIHSTNDWAQAHMNRESNLVLKHLIDQGSLVTGIDLNQAQHKALHLWRYANAKKQQSVKYLIDYKEKVAVCGDWLIQGRVEAAFTSGYNLASDLKKNIG